MSRGGFEAGGELLEAMAIWMTASMSSLVGPVPAADELDAALEAEGSEICEPSWSLGDEEDDALVGTNEGRVEDGPEDRRECGRGGDCAGVEESWADGGPLVLGWGKDTGWGIEG